MSFTTRTKTTKDDWQAPIEIVRKLGSFDLDPCANCNDPTRLANRGFTIKDDGLSQTWSGRVWLNPPYGRDAKVWLSRLADHGNGIALIPPRVGAHWFHDIVLETFDAIFFHRGRIDFIDPQTGIEFDNKSNADSVLIAYGANNVDALEKADFPGKLWRRLNTL